LGPWLAQAAEVRRSGEMGVDAAQQHIAAWRMERPMIATHAPRLVGPCMIYT
jgi:hypothetical protein